MFLEDLNNLQTQRDLDVKACELFDKISIIIIINLYILVTLIRLTHEELYAICIEWTKLFEIENHS